MTKPFPAGATLPSLLVHFFVDTTLGTGGRLHACPKREKSVPLVNGGRIRETNLTALFALLIVSSR